MYQDSERPLSGVGWVAGGPPTRVRLCGEFDVSNIESVEGVFLDAVIVGDDVVLDLRDVTFASAVLLRSLIRLRTDLCDRGGRVVLATTSRVVQRLLEITGTHDLFFYT